jgi:hypothetical protein
MLSYPHPRVEAVSKKYVCGLATAALAEGATLSIAKNDDRRSARIKEEAVSLLPAMEKESKRVFSRNL